MLGLILDAVMIIRLKLIQCLNVRRGNLCLLLGLVLIMILAAKAELWRIRPYSHDFAVNENSPAIMLRIRSEIYRISFEIEGGFQAKYR